MSAFAIFAVVLTFAYAERIRNFCSRTDFRLRDILCGGDFHGHDPQRRSEK